MNQLRYRSVRGPGLRWLLSLACFGWCTTIGLAQQFGEARPTPPPTQPPQTPPAPANLPSFPAAAPPQSTTPPTAPSTAQPTPASTGAARAQAPKADPQPQHPWSVQPSHGPWMVCVKSYSGAKSKEQAVELCEQIRTRYRAAAYLFDRNYLERRQEEERIQAYRAAKERELEPFLQMQAELRKKAQEEGSEFLEMPVKIHVPKVRIEEQWAVLVGGFKDMETASTAMKQIRAWPAPVGNHLMDYVVMQTPGEQGKASSAEGIYMNPFVNAYVVPNPSIKKESTPTLQIDPALVKLNEEEPLSVLRNPKPWTLIVKDFSIPMSVQGVEESGTFLGRMFGPNNSPEKLLEATARQARELAKALRDPNMTQAATAAAQRLGMQPRVLESFVLHVRTGSRVTVGSFDGPDDPAMQEMQRLLANMSFRIERPGENGRTIVEESRLFDGITPMLVPRVR